MVELKGSVLLGAVTTLTSLGFLMIGYDNGLFGGLGREFIAQDKRSHSSPIQSVNGDAFNATFNKPSQTMIGTIVSLFDGTCCA